MVGESGWQSDDGGRMATGGDRREIVGRAREDGRGAARARREDGGCREGWGGVADRMVRAKGGR